MLEGSLGRPERYHSEYYQNIFTQSLGVSNIDPLSALLVGNTNGRALFIRFTGRFWVTDS